METGNDLRVTRRPSPCRNASRRVGSCTTTRDPGSGVDRGSDESALRGGPECNKRKLAANAGSSLEFPECRQRWRAGWPCSAKGECGKPAPARTALDLPTGSSLAVGANPPPPSPAPLALRYSHNFWRVINGLREQFGRFGKPSPSMSLDGGGWGGGRRRSERTQPPESGCPLITLFRTGETLGSITPTPTRAHQRGGNPPAVPEHRSPACGERRVGAKDGGRCRASRNPPVLTSPGAAVPVVSGASKRGSVRRECGRRAHGAALRHLSDRQERRRYWH
jgi:hypothetical protein